MAESHSHPGTARADIEAVTPRPYRDKYLWGAYIALLFISVVELFSASSREITADNIFGPLVRHVVLLGIGFVIVILVQRMNYNTIGRWTYAIVVLSVIATLYTMFFGTIINGTRRSFSLVGISVQPSELIKLSASMLIAWVLSKSQIKGKADVTTRSVVAVAVIVLFFGALLINQGLTNTILLMAISISMMIICGVKWSKLMAVVGIYAVIGMGFMGYKYITYESPANQELTQGVEQDRTGLRRNRLANYFNSEKYKDPITSENQQEQYSYIAQANGGFFGVFPGNSREASRLPLAFSDYIYAIIIEDIGVLGGTLLLLVYLSLLARAGVVAAQCKKAYPAMLIIGMAVFIVFQALFHMAIVTGVFPVSGQPLPLISKGGSSVIITSFALGVMMSVSRHAMRKNRRQLINDEIKTLDNLSPLPEPSNADNPMLT